MPSENGVRPFAWAEGVATTDGAKINDLQAEAAGRLAHRPA
jgi:hypothetical protein